MKRVAGDVDVVIAEIGGTVGDIESLPFLEAIRQMRQESGRGNCIFVHVTLVPWIAAAQELKTKPTQHSVKELRAIGIQPDILLCRSERFISDGHEGEDRAVLRRRRRSASSPRATSSPFTKCRSSSPNRASTRSSSACFASRMPPPRDLSRWSDMVERLNNPKDEVSIGLVGKYVEYEDSYKSLKEALLHGGLAHKLKVNIHWIEAEGPRRGRTASAARRLRRRSWCPAASASAASTA